MKKALVLMAVLACSSVLMLGGLQVFAISRIDDVKITEKVLYGDKSVVEGVTVEERCTLNFRKFWDVTYVAGAKPVTDTNDYYSGDRIIEQNYTRYLEMNNLLFNGTRSAALEGSKGLRKIEEEMKKEALATGKSLEQYVHLKDHMDYYEYQLLYYLEENFYLETMYSLFNEDDVECNNSQGAKVVETFTEFFKIPVLDSEVYYVKAEFSDGRVYLSREHYSGDSWEMRVQSVVRNETCYFVFDAHTKYDNIVDTSLIPGEFGIYAIDFDKTKGAVDTDSLRCVYQLDPKEHIVKFCLDGAEEHLLLFGENRRVIDADTMETVECVPWTEYDTSVDRVWCYEDFIVCDVERTIQVYAKNTDGGYTHAFAIDPSKYGDLLPAYMFTDRDAMDYNGEKLVVTGCIRAQRHPEDPFFPYETCDFYLVVFDKNGLCYYGEYENSLEYGSRWYANTLCEPVANIPAFRVEW